VSERRLTAAIAGTLAMLTFVVHDVGYMFTHPYWLDESWVVVSTRTPFDKLGDVTAVTPVGWTALLRTVVVGSDQRQRLLPLVFAALTVVAAVGLGREIFSRPTSRLVGGALAGVAALLVPSVLVRDDLKQYTADAFVAVLLFWLVARLDADWTRRGSCRSVRSAPGDAGESHERVRRSAALLSVAAVQLVQRQWPRLVESCIVGVVTAVGMAGLYALFDRSHVVPNLRNYWAAYYFPAPGLARDLVVPSGALGSSPPRGPRADPALPGPGGWRVGDAGVASALRNGFGVAAAPRRACRCERGPPISAVRPTDVALPAHVARRRGRDRRSRTRRPSRPGRRPGGLRGRAPRAGLFTWNAARTFATIRSSMKTSAPRLSTSRHICSRAT